MKKLLLISSLFLFILSACKKEIRYSKRLMNTSFRYDVTLKWKVSEVSINGAISPFKGFWNVSENEDIENVVPTNLWVFDSTDAFMEWQFKDKGKTFLLNYNFLCEENDGSELDSLDYFCYNISGLYDVKKKKAKHMEFESSSTRGFPDQKVKIVLKR